MEFVFLGIGDIDDLIDVGRVFIVIVIVAVSSMEKVFIDDKGFVIGLGRMGSGKRVGTASMNEPNKEKRADDNKDGDEDVDEKRERLGRRRMRM